MTASRAPAMPTCANSPARPIATSVISGEDRNMLGVTDLWTYLAATVLIILLPGPNSMYVLSVAARRGVRYGYRAAGGVFVGDAILMAASAAGVASLLRASPWLFAIVKYAGAAYL